MGFMRFSHNLPLSPAVSTSSTASLWLVPNGFCRSRPLHTETLVNYIDERMPPLHYSLCGCQDLPGYPERWGGKNELIDAMFDQRVKHHRWASQRR